MVAHRRKESMDREQIGVTVPSAAASGVSQVRAGGRTMGASAPFATAWLKSESDFYLANRWCLNPFPTISELLGRLHLELRQVTAADEIWHRAEATTNALLMSCAIADTIDDYLVGARYDAGKAMAIVPIAWPVARAIDGLPTLRRRARMWCRRGLARWRRDWGIAIEEFAAATIVTPQPHPDTINRARDRLQILLLCAPLPGELQARRPRIPGAFRRHDLSHFDAVVLARKFAAESRERQRPLLVLAVRTAGSYFAPIVTACLKADGYEDVDFATIHPKKGIAPWEAARIARCANRGGQVVIVDEPLDTGATLAAVVGILRRAGIGAASVAALLPVHPQRRDWSAEFARLAIRDVRVVRLEPEEWYKHQLLAPEAVERHLLRYFVQRGYHRVKVVESAAASAFNAELARASGAYFGSRLKRVYEVHLARADGRGETRYVLAKSVGWGWFAYHAFIAAVELAPFIAPVLGLRDGILYMEWLPQSCGTIGNIDREKIVRMVGSYVAARARSLKLHDDPCPDLSRRRYHDGIELLGSVLSRACGSRVAAALHGPRIRHELSRFSGPVATLIDGRMHPEEWITADGALLKTDFEHHGLGKSTLNMTDPAYDLADAILGFGLSRNEEWTLLAHYIGDSGDRGVEERLLLNKILAGSAAMTAALARLGDPRLAARHPDANRSYLEAWHFLTTQTARFCGSVLPRAERIRWHSPLMVLDIDGVVDSRRFGFPCTTAAGIRALSLLHTHDVAIAMNTARAIGEVKEYCDAYGCAGAVAEYGSVAWDAVAGREHALASPASLRQLQRVRGALREIPGVYVDDTYRYSIRAYSFEGDSMVPLSSAMVGNLLSRLEVDEVMVRQTTIDTAIHACDVDKGRGLRALLDLAGVPDPDTVAVGDSEPDLAMFRVARRCFAPANIACRRAAVKIGCHIVDAPYQQGLLEVVRRVLHPDGGRCALCESAARATPSQGNLFLKLLGFADRARGGLLLRALADPMAIRAFVAGE